MNKKNVNEAYMAQKCERPKLVSDYAGLIAAVKAEEDKLRAVDIYLNEEGHRRLSACGKIRFLSAFCGSAIDLAEMDLYDELGGDASVTQDILMAIERIAKLEKGGKA